MKTIKEESLATPELSNQSNHPMSLSINKLVLFIPALLLFAGCTDHYNDMVKWADEEIPLGVSVDSVKSLQPDYLEIAWEHPDTISFTKDSSMVILFSVGLKTSTFDLLKMENLLMFQNDEYVGRDIRK